MKKLSLTLFFALLASVVSNASEVSLDGTVLSVDTVCHAKIGPGTWQTNLHLRGSQTLDVYYYTIDNATPGLSIRAAHPATANRLETASSMAERMSDENNVFFAGVNGDFFDVVSTYPDGSQRPRLSMYTSIVDGEIIKTSPQGQQFIIDENGTPVIGCLDFSRSYVTAGGNSATLGGVNIENINYSGDEAPDNAVTVYTRKGWKSTFQTKYAGACAEVSAKIVSGSLMGTSTLIAEVTATATSGGNLEIPADGVVLFGRGSGAGFLETLSVGERVSIGCRAAISDKSITPMQAVGGNPYIVSDGNATLSDGGRADAVEKHPRTAIGYSNDKSKIIMMVVDGRGASEGVTDNQLADLMIYAGASEAVNLDGGGSSTFYNSAFGVCNKPSDGRERTVGSGIFATVSGNVADKTVAEIRFADWKTVLPSQAVYRPVVYGYNAAGLIVDKDLEGVEFMCGSEVGEILDNGSFRATGKSGVLSASYNGLAASVPVEIRDVKYIPIESDASAWNVKCSTVRNARVSTLGNGIAVDYSMNIKAGGTITLTDRVELNDKPSYMRMRISSATAKPSKITLTLKAANAMATTAVAVDDFENDGTADITLPLDKYFDINDAAVFPLTFVSLTISPGDPGRAEGRIEMPELTVGYAAGSSDPSGIENITIGQAGSKIEWFDISGLKVYPSGGLRPGIYFRRDSKGVTKHLIR